MISEVLDLFEILGLSFNFSGLENFKKDLIQAELNLYLENHQNPQFAKNLKLPEDKTEEIKKFNESIEELE
jgi:hypothetical protein